MASRHEQHEEFDPSCGECLEEATVEGFNAAAGAPAAVTCPRCHHTFDPTAGGAAVRVTEAVQRVVEADASKPYGDVTYADPGYQKDGKKRYPIDTADHVRSAWSYVNQAKNAAKYSAADLKKVRSRIMAAAKKLGVEISEKSSEAHINGQMSFDDVRAALEKALRARLSSTAGGEYCWAYVADLTATDVVYAAQGDLFQCSYEVDTAGNVTLGEATEVVRTYAPAPDDAGQADGDMGAVEAGGAEQRARMLGRILEAKGEDEAGNRIFRVRIIAYGDSKNKRRYPEAVMRKAAPLYEGAKAYDHHRTDEELATSTINGLIGSYRNVEATAEGIDADLHLLPGATHAAEALDASIAAQEAGLQPLIGLSHDVMARFRHVSEGGVQVQEATAITQVNSADLVADPAAGGMATRMVAGGIDGTGTEPADSEEGDVPTAKEILAALKEASEEELAEFGFTRAAENGNEGESEGEEGRETEAAAVPKTGFLGGLMIERKIEAAGLPAAVIEGVTQALPDRITEADVDAQISSLKSIVGIAERAGLGGDDRVTVTQEALDKKKAALDAFFNQDWSNGYHSFKEAFADFTGRRPRTFDEDYNRVVLRESFGAGFHSAARESLDSTSWAQVLGDSVTRRMVAMYGLPSLQNWKQVVSSIVPVNDFRTQRIGRVGGYGLLPAVAEGDPYTALTSPTDEEATYAIGKKGGTEKLTIEMIANDDIRAISNIPRKLGRAAAQTLYRFVWDFIRTNAVCSYDSTALFDAAHNNTGATALSATALAAARQALMEQTAYDDTNELLDLDIVNLIVPPGLYDLAYKLVKSDKAVTNTEDATTPNVNENINLIKVPYFAADENNWYVTADPNMCPTIEVGFYQGRQDPELFTQNDPNVGSVFDSDSITYKIRHIYSGTILDHRGMYGALVA